MKKLFENVEGNKFKLLKENQINTEELVCSGLKKLFSNSDFNISYNRVESVGMGYIKDINTAKRVALQEAKRIAESFGYQDNEEEAKFTKESSVEETHSESDMSNPEEKREVQIAKEISDICINAKNPYDANKFLPSIEKIYELAQELIDMHKEDGAAIKPGTGGKALYKRGSIY